MKLIGGQAVIEGVMMKSEDKLAISVRLPNNKIKTMKEKLKKRSKIWRTPFIRGIITLWDTLFLGMKALTWSANQQLEEEEKFTTKELISTLFISFGFAILFFIVIPVFLTSLLVKYGVLFNLVEGMFRVVILFLYLIIISRFKDVKNIFEYHGAEHMAVHCYEAEKTLNVKNCKKHTTLHPRCGTAFLMIVLAISILIYSMIITPSWIHRILLRIVFLPVVASASYEVLKLSNKFKNNPIFKIFILPGLWFQKITTKKPSVKQLEVAIASLKAVI